MASLSTAAFTESARQWRGEIDQALRSRVPRGDGCPALLSEAIQYSLLSPGKRLRPLLVLMSAEACGCDRRAALPAACAVEMIHAYSLIHDDLPAMDDDDLRRGRPSCHAKYGEATAILAGDALQARAFELLSGEMHPPLTAARCCRELAWAAGAAALVGGQCDDLDSEGQPRGLRALESIHARKTGALFRVSMRLGAVAAGAAEEQIELLDRFGARLGTAFQIVDDLLDHDGDEADLGKRAGKDQTRGKLTYPSLVGVAESRRRAEQLVDEACAAAEPFGERAARLQALARFVLERTH